MLATQTKERYFWCEYESEWFIMDYLSTKTLHVHYYSPVNEDSSDEWVFEEECVERYVNTCDSCDEIVPYVKEGDRLWKCKRCGGLDSDKETADECCT